VCLHVFDAATLFPEQIQEIAIVAFGYCKLTGKQGTFVSSHILPKAVTRSSSPGLPFIEGGQGKRPVRRFDSWFDKRLVVRSGEDILSAYDNAGIAELRKHGLLWTDRPFDEVPNVTVLVPEYGFGVREIGGVDGATLRLFFLSLLWRAAASSRPEFSEITMPGPELAEIRRMILERDIHPRQHYPVILTQLTEIGDPHNLTPFPTEMAHPAHGEMEAGVIPSFRFYFDGLIAHFLRPTVLNKEMLEPYVGHVGESELVVCTQRTHDSYESSNLAALRNEAHAAWPDVMAKL
jgi:hypothetical protein